ncbi:MAG: hypothetical protein AAGD06_28210, partial [Acidobacteriota bacterium]
MGIDAAGFFREMTLRICGDLSIDRALRNAFEVLTRHVPADAIGLGHWNRDETKIRILAAAARPGASYVWGHRREDVVFPSRWQAEIRALDTPPFTIVNRLDNPRATLLAEAFPGLSSQSAVFLRLDVQDEEIGALLISAEGHDRYSPAHAELLQTIREPFA